MYSNRIEIVKLLLKQGADSNFESNDKLTPMHIAATHNNSAYVRLLFEHGANLNHISQETGKTPLDSAKNKNVINFLRSHGAKTSAELSGEEGDGEKWYVVMFFF